VKNTDWILDRVAYLKGLKSISEQQALLVLLAEKQDRSAQDERKLAALVVAEKAGVKAAKARQDVANLINAEKKAAKEAERKARNHRLILQGILFDLAGLEHRSRGELLGLLLAGATTSEPQKWQAWKVKGDALLAEKESEVQKE
jgi:hypothetical protein